MPEGMAEPKLSKECDGDKSLKSGLVEEESGGEGLNQKTKFIIYSLVTDYHSTSDRIL